MIRSRGTQKLVGWLLAVALFLAVGIETSRLEARPPHIDGKKVAERVDRVMNHYRWSESIEELKQAAAKQKKLVFWLQIVGKLDGGL